MHDNDHKTRNQCVVSAGMGMLKLIITKMSHIHTVCTHTCMLISRMLALSASQRTLTVRGENFNSRLDGMYLHFDSVNSSHTLKVQYVSLCLPPASLSPPCSVTNTTVGGGGVGGSLYVCSLSPLGFLLPYVYL